MSITIQHAADAGRFARGNEIASKPEIAHQMFTDRMEKELRQQGEQVNKANEAEQNQLNPERQGHGGGYQRKGKNKKNEKDEKKPPPKTISRFSEGLLDVKI